MTPEKLVSFLEKGRHVRVAKAASDNRHIMIRGRCLKIERNVAIPKENYESFMEQTVTLLAERHGFDLQVSVEADFYGNQWIEVRSGQMWKRRSRAGFSARHIRMLLAALGERETEDEAA